MIPANAAPSAAEPVFSAVLRPHRSLSPRGFGVLMAAIVACSFAIGLGFWLMGAWPVVGFSGLDILLVQLAFRLNYWSGQASEEIRLTPDRLSVKQVSARGVAVETGFNPYWARIEVDRHPEFGVTALRIASHGARLAVGAFLGPAERERFANAFSAALSGVRHARPGEIGPLQETGG